MAIISTNGKATLIMSAGDSVEGGIKKSLTEPDICVKIKNGNSIEVNKVYTVAPEDVTVKVSDISAEGITPQLYSIEVKNE